MKRPGQVTDHNLDEDAESVPITLSNFHGWMKVGTPERFADPPLLLRPRQVAELLNLSRSKVYEMGQRGELPGWMKLSGSIRVHRPTLEAWLAEEAAPSHWKGDTR